MNDVLRRSTNHKCRQLPMAALHLCLFVLLGQEALCDTPSTATAKVDSLITQLGDSSFAVREAATTRLAAMDVSIRPALKEAAKSRDAEVRTRARRILEVVSERDLQERLSAFAADVEGKQGADLPGWSRFQSIVGKDLKARELFVELQRAEPLLLEVAESKLENINDLIASRFGDGFAAFPFGRAEIVSNVSAAALVFVASDPQVTFTPEVEAIVGNAAIRGAFSSSSVGRRGEDLKKLLTAWVLRETDDTGVLARNVSLAIARNLAVGRELPIKALMQTAMSPAALASAMSLLAQSGTKADAALLERFLTDETVLATANRNDPKGGQLKLCDVAMAMMIVLTRNRPDQFRHGPLRWNQGWNADQETLGFRSDEDRKEALAKRDTWWKENKDKLGNMHGQKKDR